jgi:hypothetical protein
MTFVLSMPGFAQIWVATYDGPGNSTDVACAIAVDENGYIYVTGHSEDSITHYDYATVKYSSTGQELWVRRYNGPANSYDFARTIAVDTYGNVYVTGDSPGVGTHDDYATVKYDSLGEELWVARYTTNRDDGASAIALDGSGNVYVTGHSMSEAGTDYDYATVKYDLSGVQQWVRRYDGPGSYNDVASAIGVDDSGNVYVTGHSAGSSTYDYATIKYNTFGLEQWIMRYDGPGSGTEEAYAMAVDGDYVYVTGSSADSAINHDYATIKYDSSGMEQWVRRYDGPGHYYDRASAIAVDGSGNVYVTGFCWGLDSLYEYATIKYDSHGNVLWTKRYDGPGNSDFATAIAVDGSGNVYVTGDSPGVGTHDDYATVKYDSSGVEQWIARHNGPADSTDRAHAIAVDDQGDVYVTGSSTDAATCEDYTTIKYSGVGVTGKSSLRSRSPRLRVFPNPFLYSTAITYHLPAKTNISLEIYDVAGRPVKTLVNGEKEAGSHSVSFSARSGSRGAVKDLTSGVYFAKLSVSDGAGNYESTNKLILVR